MTGVAGSIPSRNWVKYFKFKLELRENASGLGSLWNFPCFNDCLVPHLYRLRSKHKAVNTLRRDRHECLLPAQMCVSARDGDGDDCVAGNVDPADAEDHQPEEGSLAIWEADCDRRVIDRQIEVDRAVDGLPVLGGDDRREIGECGDGNQRDAATPDERKATQRVDTLNERRVADDNVAVDKSQR